MLTLNGYAEESPWKLTEYLVPKGGRSFSQRRTGVVSRLSLLFSGVPFWRYSSSGAANKMVSIACVMAAASSLGGLFVGLYGPDEKQVDEKQEEFHNFWC